MVKGEFAVTSSKLKVVTKEVPESKPDTAGAGVPEGEDEEYDEEEDEDYDPAAKAADLEGEEDNAEESKGVPDYSKIEAGEGEERLVQTRSQRFHNKEKKKDNEIELIQAAQKSDVDVDSLFREMKSSSWRANDAEWRQLRESSSQEPAASKENEPLEIGNYMGAQKIQIEFSYTFAGKVMTESKLVDADSAEAKAYLNSTNGIVAKEKNQSKELRSFITVQRIPPGETEPVELKVKLKRPSLIDKYLAAYSNKRQKLSTLEMSRLQWASFIDLKNLKDELKLHNKAGYLDKQDFLSRVQERRDEDYKSLKTKIKLSNDSKLEHN